MHCRAATAPRRAAPQQRAPPNRRTRCVNFHDWSTQEHSHLQSGPQKQQASSKHAPAISSCLNCSWLPQLSLPLAASGHSRPRQGRSDGDGGRRHNSAKGACRQEGAAAEAGKNAQGPQGETFSARRHQYSYVQKVIHQHSTSHRDFLRRYFLILLLRVHRVDAWCKRSCGAHS